LKGKKGKMNITILIENNQVIPLTSGLEQLSQFLGCVQYEIKERIELTISTEDNRLLSAVSALVSRPESIPEESSLPVMPAETMPEIKQEIVASGGSQGMVACNAGERTAICPNCQRPFIRRRKDQDYCMKPECQKAKRKEYAKEYNKLYNEKKKLGKSIFSLDENESFIDIDAELPA
jgi:hypothetical protein